MKTTRRSPAFAASLVSALALTACANLPAADVASEAIVGGTRGGDPAVVWVSNRGGMCTGTLIDPRVVLTAKHCVQNPGVEQPSSASSIMVGFGDQVFSGRTVRVQSVHTTPGVYYDDGFLTGLRGIDVAVLVLSTAVTDVEPIPVRRTPPDDLVGQPITAIGFGQIPSGRSGSKYTAQGMVRSIFEDIINVGTLICPGDSGGPLVTADRQVAGVVSYGEQLACGSADGSYNAIYGFLDMIDDAIEEGGGCVDHGSEWCDGADNDCNGEVDEGCIAIGEPCETDAQCIGTTCRETVAGRICTEACNALHPELGCGDGSYCSRSGDAACEGYCVPGAEPAGLALEAACESDAECASRYCADPGDGMRRCLAPCQGDAGGCLAGEVCVAGAGACGGCIPAERLRAPRGFGEPCRADGECASGDCHPDGDVEYCTRACDADTACPSQYHCRAGACVRGRLAGLGETCATHEDCGNGTACAVQGGRRWCTYPCDETSPCAAGFTCVETSSDVRVCEPDRGIIGDLCATDDECISGTCGADGHCTRECGPDAACGVGFECRRAAAADAALCVRPVPPSTGGGCAVGAGSRASSAGVLMVLAGLVLALRRRRAAR